MLGFVLIGAAVATALLGAACARLESLVSTLLLAYLAFVAELGIVTLALSPFREVTRSGLAAAEGVLLAAALAVWWRRGRPGFALSTARAAVRLALSDPVTALFLVVVAAALTYEAVLASTPPNNMDSLTYHLARAAAWAQHGGLFWIQHAPEVELNAYQPLAEQQDLFYLVATGGGAFYAAPQYLAELATLVAVYGSSRRLGFEVRSSACAAALLATFSVIALEAVTAQNDLVAASFTAVAACLLLGGGRLEPALAGAAVAFGLGTKLTTGLVVPILAWLALARGRRTVGLALGGGIAGLAALGMWGYVLNTIHTGHVLGEGTGVVQDRGSPSYPASVANAFYLAYGLMDISVLSHRLIEILATAGLAAAICIEAWWLRRRLFRRALVEAARTALPFLAPALVIAMASALAIVARRWGFPIRGPGGVVTALDIDLNEQYTRIANEDYSAFGPVGIVALVAAAALAVRAFATRRADIRHLALALALPFFLAAISLSSTWVPFLIRYFTLPAVLTAPLLAALFRSRLAGAAYLLVATVSVALTLVHDQPKPLESPYGFGRPWDLTQVEAVDQISDPGGANALAAYERLVPARACVGAVLGENEPSYLLFGPHLEHRVIFLDNSDPAPPAEADGLTYVVVSSQAPGPGADSFLAAGWKMEPLAGGWNLAVDPHHRSRSCR